MRVEQSPDHVIVTTPAKVNLHLEVLGKREDGFHEIETLMVAIDLCDVLTFQSAPAGTTVRCDDPSLSVGPDNLVTRAAELIRAESGRRDGVLIDLSKRIPMAAGLAGGSSDAAACLEGLNRWWGLNWPRERLAELGAQLGSDVPFFFHLPAAIARGRGERLESCPVGTSLSLVVVAPTEGLSTKEVYRRVMVPARPQGVGTIAEALAMGDAARVASLLFNRLEEAAFMISPVARRLKDESHRWGCLGSLMSGSGSAFYAIAASPPEAEELAQSIRANQQARVFVTQTRR